MVVGKIEYNIEIEDDDPTPRINVNIVKPDYVYTCGDNDKIQEAIKEILECFIGNVAKKDAISLMFRSMLEQKIYKMYNNNELIINYVVEQKEEMIVKKEEPTIKKEKYLFKMPIIYIDEINRNGRLYTPELCKRIVDDWHNSDYEHHDAIVTKSNPDGTYDFKNIVGVVKDLVIEDNKVFAIFVVTDHVFKDLLMYGNSSLIMDVEVGGIKEKELLSKKYQEITDCFPAIFRAIPFSHFPWGDARFDEERRAKKL